jgi:hypothetical protein
MRRIPFTLLLFATLLAPVFAPRAARAQNAEQLNEIEQSNASAAPATVAPKPAEPAKPFNPDAKRFLAPPAFSYWAGTERTRDGELSYALPRPLAEDSLLPAVDDHLGAAAYARYAHEGILKGGRDWNLAELDALQDLKAGAALGVHLRADARETTGVQGGFNAAIPIPLDLFLVPSFELGAGSDYVARAIGGAELHTDERAPRDYAFGVEGSGWSGGRARVLGKIGTLQRLSARFALEERVAAGAWVGPLMGGQAAVIWTSAAVQTMSERLALYERCTLTRGAALTTAIPSQSAFFVDGVVGARWTTFKPYGLAIEAGGGGEISGYGRWEVAVTGYGNLL